MIRFTGIVMVAMMCNLNCVSVVMNRAVAKPQYIEGAHK